MFCLEDTKYTTLIRKLIRKFIGLSHQQTFDIGHVIPVILCVAYYVYMHFVVVYGYLL